MGGITICLHDNGLRHGGRANLPRLTSLRQRRRRTSTRFSPTAIRTRRFTRARRLSRCGWRTDHHRHFSPRLPSAFFPTVKQGSGDGLLVARWRALTTTCLTCLFLTPPHHPRRHLAFPSGVCAHGRINDRFTAWRARVTILHLQLRVLLHLPVRQHAALHFYHTAALHARGSTSSAAITTRRRSVPHRRAGNATCFNGAVRTRALVPERARAAPTCWHTDDTAKIVPRGSACVIYSTALSTSRVFFAGGEDAFWTAVSHHRPHMGRTGPAPVRAYLSTTTCLPPRRATHLPHALY